MQQNESYRWVAALEGKEMPPELKTVDLLFGQNGNPQKIKVAHHDALSPQLKYSIRDYARPKTVVYEQVSKIELDNFKRKISKPSSEVTNTEEWWLRLFNRAAREGASDIHMITYEEDPHVLFRVNGELERVIFDHEVTSEQLVAVARTIYMSMTGGTASNKNTYLPALTQSATLQDTFDDVGRRYRLRYQDAVLNADEKSVHVTLRLLDLDKDFSKGSLKALGYESDQEALVYDVMLKGGGGLVILVGATGDGKTTSAANILGRLATVHNGKKMIITAEDPVEFKIKGVNHTQVDPQRTQSGETETTEQAWERHLSALMRRDPDFILQGEMRSPTTAKSAAHSALTGHTTLVTLHGNSAFDAFVRMNELGLPHTLLGTEGFIKGIIFQRLLPVLCPHCSIPMKEHTKDNFKSLIDQGHASESLIKRLVTSFGKHALNVRFRNHDGCDHCRNGIVGREAAAEVLKLDASMCQEIAKGKVDKAREMWKSQRDKAPMIDSDEDLDAYYNQHCVGFTAFDHAVKKMLHGKISPVDVEDRLDVISQGAVMADQTFSGGEVGRLLGTDVASEANYS